MATRTVRLDEESERILREIRRRTGASVSAVLKQGLVAARHEIRAQASLRPYDVFQRLDIGAGGYAPRPAREAKVAVRRLLAARHARRDAR